MIHILKNCAKEIADFPEDVREELVDAFNSLDQGEKLSMPLWRPMPSIGRGTHELRFRDRAGIYRVIYTFFELGQKTQKTPQRSIDLAKRRLKEIEK